MRRAETEGVRVRHVADHSLKGMVVRVWPSGKLRIRWESGYAAGHEHDLWAEFVEKDPG